MTHAYLVRSWFHSISNHCEHFMDATRILSLPPSERITLQQLARQQGVSPVTCWRWALRGVGGVRLLTIKVGRKRLTHPALFEEFCRQLTEAANSDQVSASSDSSLRDDAIIRAEKQAKEFGV
jgi:hypothetical protein